MPHYRLYCLDEKLHIIEQREFDATGDAEAIAAVQFDHPESDREIWQERRKVALVRATMPRRHQ